MLRYFIFYKPFQVLSQFSREGDKKTLADYFSSLSKDIYPVGRLDYDSEGLLLLTDDKQITHRLLEPKFEHRRTYWVQVEGQPAEDDLDILRTGVEITTNGAKYTTRPAEVKLFSEEPKVAERNPPIRFRKNVPTSWLELTLTEGKNRQVRKMTAAAGYPTLRLIRYSLGKLTIDGLAPGDYRELSADERQLLLL
jgi:23S rRNA pseudouridine2457 synthase